MKVDKAEIFPRGWLLAIWVLGFLGASTFAASPPRLSIAPVGVQENAGVANFQLSVPGVVISDPGLLPNVAAVQSSRGGYSLYVVSTADTKNNLLSVTVYVVRPAQDEHPATIYRYVFTEAPSGRFLDCKASATVSIQDDEGTETALITVPLHSPDTTIDFIGSDDRAPAESVDASSYKTLDVPVINKLGDLGVTVTNISVSTDHPEKWKKLPVVAPDTPGPVHIGPTQTLTVRIGVTPKFWRAVKDSVLPGPETQADDNFRIEISYASDNGGLPRLFIINKSVRFVNLPGAIFFGLIGAFLGCVSVYYGGSPQGTTLARTYLSRGASAVLLIVLGIFLVAGGSKFVLFTLNLDPRQLLAAFLVGGLVGVGLVDVVAFIKALAKKGTKGANG